MSSTVLKKALLVLVGSFITAIGLEYFLVPNQLLDGGVVGLSIISAYLSHLPLGIFLAVFNAPFLYLGYHKFGREFAAYSTLGIVSLVAFTFLIQPNTPFTGDELLAAIFGGLFVGIGVGLVIRYGGTLDGGDTVAIMIDKHSVFSVGEIIMIINVVILTLSGFIFGWDNAMYSMVAYFVAYKTIDLTVEGITASRSVWIVSEKYLEIGQALKDQANRKTTYFKDSKPAKSRHRGIIMTVVTRFEEQLVKEIVLSIDPKAFIVINSSQEVIGETYKERK